LSASSENNEQVASIYIIQHLGPFPMPQSHNIMYVWYDILWLDL